MEQTGADHSPMVHVVDDDGALRESVSFLLSSVDIPVRTHATATRFLDELDPQRPGVVILDVRMPDYSGFQVQEQLRRRDCPAPVIFCSAHGDISLSVRALRGGAVDFLEKPYEPQKLLESVQESLGLAGQRFVRHRQQRQIRDRLATLTPRECDVLRLLLEGLSSQNIARRLGTSVKTVDVHRARIKAKADAEALGVFVNDLLRHRIPV